MSCRLLSSPREAGYASVVFFAFVLPVPVLSRHVLAYAGIVAGDYVRARQIGTRTRAGHGAVPRGSQVGARVHTLVVRGPVVGHCSQIGPFACARTHVCMRVRARFAVTLRSRSTTGSRF